MGLIIVSVAGAKKVYDMCFSDKKDNNIEQSPHLSEGEETESEYSEDELEADEETPEDELKNHQKNLEENSEEDPEEALAPASPSTSEERGTTPVASENGDTPVIEGLEPIFTPEALLLSGIHRRPSAALQALLPQADPGEETDNTVIIHSDNEGSVSEQEGGSRKRLKVE